MSRIKRGIKHRRQHHIKADGAEEVSDVQFQKESFPDMRGSIIGQMSALMISGSVGRGFQTLENSCIDPLLYVGKSSERLIQLPIPTGLFGNLQAVIGAGNIVKQLAQIGRQDPEKR